MDKFKPTMKLRLKVERSYLTRRPDGPTETRISDPVLQQLWVWSSDDGDESEEEWRDVPVVEVEV